MFADAFSPAQLLEVLGTDRTVLVGAGAFKPDVHDVPFMGDAGDVAALNRGVV